MLNRLIPLAAAFALTACQGEVMDSSDPNYVEMEELKAWGRQLKAEDPDTARGLMRQCWGEGSLQTAEGKLVIARCMRRKYDEGYRAG